MTTNERVTFNLVTLSFDDIGELAQILERERQRLRELIKQNSNDELGNQVRTGYIAYLNQLNEKIVPKH